MLSDVGSPMGFTPAPTIGTGGVIDLPPWNAVQLTNYLVSKQQELRSAIALEIHDDLGNDIAALRMFIKSFESLEGSNNPQLVAALETIENLAESCRRIMMGLRPSSWGQGLEKVIYWLCKDFERRHRIALALKIVVAPETLTDPETNLQPGSSPFLVRNNDINSIHHTLFRVLQEALMNIAKHAQASRIEVLLELKTNHYLLEVADDGVGLAANAMTKPNAFGLRGMLARAKALQGDIQWLEDGGTRVVLKIPV